jgi:hypothetical protein
MENDTPGGFAIMWFWSLLFVPFHKTKVLFQAPIFTIIISEERGF